MEHPFIVATDHTTQTSKHNESGNYTLTSNDASVRAVDSCYGHDTSPVHQDYQSGSARTSNFYELGTSGLNSKENFNPTPPPSVASAVQGPGVEGKAECNSDCELRGKFSPRSTVVTNQAWAWWIGWKWLALLIILAAAAAAVIGGWRVPQLPGQTPMNRNLNSNTDLNFGSDTANLYKSHIVDPNASHNLINPDLPDPKIIYNLNPYSHAYPKSHNTLNTDPNSSVTRNLHHVSPTPKRSLIPKLHPRPDPTSNPEFYPKSTRKSALASTSPSASPKYRHATALVIFGGTLKRFQFNFSDPHEAQIDDDSAMSASAHSNYSTILDREGVTLRRRSYNFCIASLAPLHRESVANNAVDECVDVIVDIITRRFVDRSFRR